MRSDRVLAAGAALAAACVPTAGPEVAAPSSFHVVAEGPCQKLSPARFGDRTLLIVGETGYTLSDWDAGEPWPAAQSVVELAGGDFGESRSLLRGLPQDDRGWVPFDIRVGQSSGATPWLRLTETSYAARGTGALVKRSYVDFTWERDGWAPDERAIDLGGKLRGLSEGEPCEDARLTFVPLDHAIGRDGSVFIAGRCQDAQIVAYEDTTLVVAVAGPKDKVFSYARLPRTAHLEGTLNVDIEVEDATRAWLVAYEPFTAPEGRQSYFARWDGARFEEVDLGIDKGLMSVAHTEGGHLWIAASSALMELTGDAAPRVVPLPKPRFSRGTPEVHVHTVSSPDGRSIWVQGTYRVQTPEGPEGQLVARDASVLFSTAETRGTLYCDAREPREKALAVVEGAP